MFLSSDCQAPLCVVLLLFFCFSQRAPLSPLWSSGYWSGGRVVASAPELAVLLASLFWWLSLRGGEGSAHLCSFSLSSKCLMVRLAPGYTLQLETEMSANADGGSEDGDP